MESIMIAANSRRARRMSACLGAILMAVAAVAHATTDTSTMTIGSVNTGFGVWTGFQCCGTGSFGSMSPSTLTGGESYNRWYDVGSSLAYFTISGFTSNPGSSWLSSASCVGTSKTGATATYSYSSGAATWSWTSSFGFAAALHNGQNGSCSVTHS
jgi:hypothetical protein